MEHSGSCITSTDISLITSSDSVEVDFVLDNRSSRNREFPQTSGSRVRSEVVWRAR